MFYSLLVSSWMMQPLLGAEAGSEVLYMDEEVNFLLIDQVAGDLKDGDRLCVYHSSLIAPFCQAQFRWISRKPLVFLPADMMNRFQVGSRLEIKKIYVSDKRPDGSGYVDATSFGRDYLAKKQGDVRAEQLQTEQTEQPKVPKGEAPHIQTDTPAVEGGEFPEIFIPKIRKQKARSKKDSGETAETIAAIKKSLKEKGPTNFQFLPVRAELTQKEAEAKEEEKTEDEIPPTPLHQAIDVTILQTLPILPVAAFQGLRYRTITSDTLNRSTLWVKNSTELSPILGAGFSLNLMQNLSRIVGFGWRYHIYDRAQSRSTYDEIETRLEARTTTRISAQAVHAETGWRFAPWGDWMLLDMAPGIDLFYSDVWFKATIVDTTTTESQALAYAHSSFFFVAPRWHSAVRFQYHGWALALGGIVSVPVVSFKKNFDGAATASDRLTYSADPVTDLNNSLTHKIRTVGFEAYLGLSYQPQRN